MAQQKLDQPPLARTEMTVDAAARKPVEEGYRLLCQKFFEFVGCHFKCRYS
jgi:hypothetical protein